ncbi:DUF3631 domain-containing protein [Myceligenerans cantabricum]
MNTTAPATPPLVQPEPPTDGAALLNQVAAAFRKYVILPDEHALTGVVLWAAATHAAPAWAHATRLVIRAPEKRCGKSRLLQIVQALSHRPLMSINVSSSAMYRSIAEDENDPPTVLMDEADTVFGPKAGENEDLRGLLNGGFDREGYTLRYDAGIRKVERLSTFAMAALAGIGEMPDTIEDRAVVVVMRRRAPGETVAPYRVRRDRPGLDKLRADLGRWMRSKMRDLELATPPMPIEDRAADLWEPLIAVADEAGGDWPDAARAAAIALSEAREASATKSMQTRLLADCRAAFADADALPTAALVERLKLDDEAPWQTYGKVGLTPRQLADLLREFNIASANITFPTGRAKGYHRGAFTDAWNRYCPPITTD